MIKLLLLTVLGLAIGGGAWKAQNPDGTLNDLKTQGIASFDRLKSGVESGIDTVVGHPETLAAEADIDERLAVVEEQLEAGSGALQAEELQAIVDEKLANNANSLASLQATLNDRVAPMESMTAAVAELDTALQDTRARTDASNVRLDAIDRRLELLVRRLDEQTTEASIQSLSEDVEALQASTDTLQSASDNKLGEIEEGLATLSEQQENLTLRLDTLVSDATLLQAAADVEASADAQTATSGITPNQAAGMDRRLAAIEQRLSTVNSDSRRIASQNEELASARSQIEDLEEQNAVLSSSLAELANSVDELTMLGESLSIEAIQAKVQDQLAQAQSQFDANEANASSADTEQLTALLDATRNRIQTLEQRVQSLPAASTETDDAVLAQSALQAQIADLEQRLEAITSSDPALVSKVNDVKQQVEQLSAQGFVTQDELRATTESAAIEYKIYFDSNSTEISEDAAQVLNSFITQEKNRTTGVSIFGFTDRSGSAAYNQQLALQRATNVRSYLIQNGLDFTKIQTLSGLGEDAAAAVMPDDASDAEQRVVVLYAAQP